MKEKNEQSGLYGFNTGWFFYDGELDNEASRAYQTTGLYGKGCVTAGPLSVDYDHSEWDKVQLPHDGCVRHPFTETDRCGAFHGGKKRGTGWYRKCFDLPEDAEGKQVLLEFEGMSQPALIFVNGVLVQRNTSGYHPLLIDISDVVHAGGKSNVIAVFMPEDDVEGWWYEGLGIYRTAWLLIKDPVHIVQNSLFVRPDSSCGSWETNVSLMVENQTDCDWQGELVLTIEDPEGHPVAEQVQEIVIPAWQSLDLTSQLPVQEPVRWSLSNPVRYRARAQLRKDKTCLDASAVRYGYRTIRFDAETGFYLNEEPVKLKGFCIHQDHAGLGVAVPYSVKAYRLQCLKKLGANAIRTAHHTDPEIAELCDEMGLLLMEENRSFRTDSDTILHVRDMVRRARNHPSVIMYALYNEEPLQQDAAGRKIAAHLKREIRALDPTRPVTGANNAGVPDENGTAAVLDLIGLNYHIDAYDETHARFPDKPIVATETSSALMTRGEGESDADRHVVRDDGTETVPWGAGVLEAWRAVEKRDYVAGAFVWTGFDYRGEPLPYTWPSVASNFGALDSCGFRKHAAYLYQALWTSEPVIHVSPDLDQPWDEGTEVIFTAATNCEEAELFLNGQSLGRKKASRDAMPSWQAPYAYGKMRAVGYVQGEEAAAEEQYSPGASTRLYVMTNKSRIAYDGQDAVVVNAEARDAMGHVVPSADQLIFFETEGGAEVIATGSGNPNSHEEDEMYYHHLFHGRAQAVIRNNDGADVIVRAYAEELQPDEMFLETYEADVPEEI